MKCVKNADIHQKAQNEVKQPAEKRDYLDEPDGYDSAFFTIFMYYVQVPPLLQIQLLYEGNRYLTLYIVAAQHRPSYCIAYR